MPAEKKRKAKKTVSKKRIIDGSIEAIEVAIKIAKNANLDFSYLKR